MRKYLALVLVVLTAFLSASPATAATSGQRNALRSAESYLSMTAFSKSGLVKQPQFEHFSRSDARWAASHVRVSWNAQAVKSARAYLRMTSFSRDGLVTQLEFEGFTHSQALYGVRKAYH